MTVQNPFIAKARLQSLKRYLPVSRNFVSEDDGYYIPENFFFDEFPSFHPITRLSDNIAISMRMMSEIQKLKDELPGIDCGSCGAPSCRAFAEDVVCGKTSADNCIIMYKEKIKDFLNSEGTENDGK